MQCLVCGGPAKDITPGGFDGLIINCQICEPYEIAESVLHKFDKIIPEKRAAALLKAKRFTPAGTRPAINNTCL